MSRFALVIVAGSFLLAAAVGAPTVATPAPPAPEGLRVVAEAILAAPTAKTPAPKTAAQKKAAAKKAAAKKAAAKKAAAKKAAAKAAAAKKAAAAAPKPVVVPGPKPAPAANPAPAPQPAPVPASPVVPAPISRPPTGTPVIDTPACTDTTYVLEPWRATSTFNWYYNPAGAPASVADNALSTLQAGTTSVFTGQNRCGSAPKLSLSEQYQGTSTATAQVSASGACTGNDNKSVTSWGDLPPQTLAYTCTYYRGNGSIVSSDMLIDNKVHQWFTTKPASCSNKFDLLAVVVHERGHTVGLNHVDQATHGQATMSPRTLACDVSERTFSAGDLAGLVALYGVR